MTFTAEIKVMPHKEILDPQGKAVEKSMKNLHLSEISGVRIGKNIILKVEADDQASAEAKVKAACDKLLANPIMESYDFTLRAN